MASSGLANITSHFQVHQPSGVCKTPTTISLLLLSLWVPVAVCSLICGTSIFRQRLSCTKKHPRTVEPTNKLYLFTSLFGSFFFQAVVWAIVQGQLLADDDSTSSISDLYWVWLIRPWPATFVLFMAYICPTLYLENALELQCVEGVIGMLTVGIYDGIRKAINGFGDFSTHRIGDEDLRTGLEHIAEGAKLGFAFWILSFFIALAVLVLLVIGMGSGKPSDKSALRIALRLWISWSIIFNASRMIAGFLIWTGVAQLDDGAFCPNLAATGGIAAVAFASTLVDHAWRAYFWVEGASFSSLGSVAW